MDVRKGNRQAMFVLPGVNQAAGAMRDNAPPTQCMRAGFTSSFLRDAPVVAVSDSEWT
ncbi:hypothetical protein ACS15_5034 [Ralstonia insidiosa]|uniref:Uncharacterized protein n=1 Tax=Ralstonia insidiosa TaxID=190721 RepID=A0AAC9FUG4_9RALS|nr:hypothetical protein ACS15_5034 [Ralstonia insidiosa]